MRKFNIAILALLLTALPAMAFAADSPRQRGDGHRSDGRHRDGNRGNERRGDNHHRSNRQDHHAHHQHRSHGGNTRFFFSFNSGYPRYYYYPYYAPPPVVYTTPRVIYAPPTVVTYAPPASLPAEQTSPTYTDDQGRFCREFQSTAIIDGEEQATYGTACLQPDGAWRVVP